MRGLKSGTQNLKNETDKTESEQTFLIQQHQVYQLMALQMHALHTMMFAG